MFLCIFQFTISCREILPESHWIDIGPNEVNIFR